MADATEKMTGQELGIRLRKVRDRREQSLSTVAKLADISTAYLQKLESGSVRQPSPRILLQLSKALETEYAELMRLAGYLIPSDHDQLNLRPRNELTHARSSESLTEDEANELVNYLDWYRSRQRASG